MFSSKWPKNLTFFSLKTTQKMIKKIFIKNEKQVMNVLKKGQVVEGRLKIEKAEDGRICLCFKAWERTAPKCGYRDKGKIIMRTEHGWVKESKERIKTYESVPKNLGKKVVTSVLERDMYEACDFLMTYSETNNL